MKKTTLALLCAGLGCLAAAFLAACDPKESEEEGVREYGVNCRDGEYYDLSAAAFAAVGESVTVTVQTEPFVKVDAVYANDAACAAGSTEGTYTFTMPAGEVTVTARISGVEVASDGGMSWSKAPAVISVFDESELTLYEQQEYEVAFGTQGVIASIGQDGGMIYAEAVSLNEDVIPSDAITAIKGFSTSSSNSHVFMARFSIDRTKLSKGTATIVFFDTDHDRAVSRTITVVGYGEVYKDEAWRVSVTADLSGVSSGYTDGNLRLYFEETGDTYVYGSVYLNAVQLQEFTSADLQDGKFTAQFYYVPSAGKEYRVWVAYEGESNSAFQSLSEEVVASFTENGGSMTVTVQDPE